MIPSLLRQPARPAWLAALAALGLAGAARAGPPPEGQCPTFHASLAAGVEDAAPRRMAPGVPVGYEHLEALQHLLPEEIWANRKVFFHAGMRMVIGDCHRRYPTPRFFAEATQQLAGKVTLDADGNLRGYVAGLPFPPEQIDPKAP